MRDRQPAGTSIPPASAQDDPALRSRRKGGRPSRVAAQALRDHILDAATGLFLNHGYGMTSIEAVARAARISKRTFYHRFTDKGDLFRAVVQRIIARLHPPAGVPLVGTGGVQDDLQHLARLMLRGALSPQGLALFRLVMAESARFPELAAIAAAQGGRQEAIELVSGLLVRHARTENVTAKNPTFAAQQFLQMVTTIPQRRALGLGAPMTENEVERWVRDTVDLFLHGCLARSEPARGA